ncbi:hypothetical protein [Streptomyces sudanensis]|uniref:hypothetical protein n=1 Tax=Streptomyces sudanensis TaxID=436397 RepID=UPI0020CBB1B1|nr:hypothetical protein [Streptomyces sudanensis]MCP9958618.1 hypothetical protein [Streptomyces sudanensis]MCP9987718.1 hypothetical protein [Streptomyces sudanensis]MCQ0000880.1 hypothetical protein [Streptomyces sudanensis]
MMRHTRLAAALLSGVVMTTGMTVAAQAAPAAGNGTSAETVAAAVPDPGVTKQAGKWCTYSKWGGTFYCKSQLKHKLPNGHFQVFVIGTNKQAYSRWSSPKGGVSKWTSLGGTCIKPGQGSIGMAWVGKNKWNFAITCIGSNNKRYYKEREANGKWSGWRLNKY